MDEVLLVKPLEPLKRAGSEGENSEETIEEEERGGVQGGEEGAKEDIGRRAKQ